MTAKSSPSPRGTKRSSSTFSSGDESKKTRGRPRVEPQDETAADRRRTQIRLAQRTYRQRKESTITALQTKVSQLETIIHEMHASVQGVKQDAKSAKLDEICPGFSRKFADTAKKFDQLAKDANSGKKQSRSIAEDSFSDEIVEIPKPKRGRTSKPPLKTNTSPSKDAPKQPQPTIVSEKERGVPSVWGYETIYDDPPDAFRGTGADPGNGAVPFEQTLMNPYATTSLPGYFDQTLSAPVSSYAGWAFTAPLTPAVDIPLPSSIAFQETSFGRRLHRTVLEAAVRLLNDPFPDPKKLYSKFSHVMKFASQQEIAERLYRRLLRSKTEPLESNFNYPSILYYGPYAQQEWKLPPEHQAQAEVLMAEDNVGDGAWFAPDDVQTYLEQKGLFIEPSATVVEWETELIMSPRLAKTYSPALSTRSDAVNNTPNSLDGSLYDINSNGTSCDPMSMAGDPVMNMSSFNGASSIGFLPPVNSYIPTPSTTPEHSDNQLERAHKRVTINVNVLIGELIKAAVCLGRSPGFRRRDVEKAFHTSITEVVAF